MNDDLGFFIESLTLKGPAKADAQLTFSDGLNVVSGASVMSPGGVSIATWR